MAFNKRWSVPCLLVAVVALLAGTGHANMEVTSSTTVYNTGYNGFVYTIGQGLPTSRVPVYLDLQHSSITGGGLTIDGWADTSVHGEYSFQLLLDGFTIQDSSLIIKKGIPADGAVHISSVDAVNTQVAAPPFDFSGMTFTNNLTMSIKDSFVTLSGSAANTPIVQAGGNGNVPRFSYYTTFHIAGMKTTGGSCVLSLPTDGNSQSVIAVEDHAVVSVTDARSCGLRDAVVSVGRPLVVSQYSYLRIRNCELNTCTTASTDDPALSRTPDTVLRSDAGSITVSAGSVVLIKDVVAQSSSILQGYDNGITGVFLGDESTLSVINVTASSFCPTCTNGVPTTSTGSSLVYAGQWTIGGSATTDYNSQGLGGATDVDANGRDSRNQCTSTQCIRHYTVGTPTGTNCACNCRADTYAPGCFAKPDVMSPTVTCDDSNCRTCALSAATCTSCRIGWTVDGSGVCVRTPCSVPNCDACSLSNPNVCQSCSLGYTLNTAGTCDKCTSPYCLKCDADKDVCTSCAEGYSLVSGSCVATSSLCSVPNCKACVDNNYVQCKECNSGYGLTSTGTCHTCATPNCKNCDGDANVCKVCANGYFVTKYGTCSPVQCDLPYCAACDATDPSRCGTCISGYYVNTNDGQCVTAGTCLVPDCDKCVSSSPNICETCSAGYTRDPTTSQCVSVSGNCRVSNCAQCVTGNPLKCASCNSGYVITSTGLCGSGGCLVYYCAQCVSDDPRRCRVCNNGYGITTEATCVKARPSQPVNGASRGPLPLVAAATAVLLCVLLSVF